MQSNVHVVRNERASMVISRRPRLCGWKMTGFVEGFSKIQIYCARLLLRSRHRDSVYLVDI